MGTLGKHWQLSKLSILKPGFPFYGKHHSFKAKQKMSESGKKNWKRPEYIQRIKRIHREQWKKPEYVRMIIKAQRKKPNQAEIMLYSILQGLLPNEYALNVKAEIMVLGGKIPDFVNINGQKKLIELYGDYWHRNDNPQNRIDHFKKYEFNCLVI